MPGHLLEGLRGRRSTAPRQFISQLRTRPRSMPCPAIYRKGRRSTAPQQSISHNSAHRLNTPTPTQPKNLARLCQ